MWSNGIKKFMAEKGIQPDLIYTSEEADAPQYMEHLGIETVLVDPKRTFMSISGAQIRETRSATGNIFLRKLSRSLCVPWRSLAASRAVNPPW